MGLILDTAIGLSKQRESAYNTHFTLAGEYMGIPVNPQGVGVLFPQMEKTDDVGVAGHEFPTTVCNQWWLPTAIQLAYKVNFDDVGRLLLRHFGGTITTTVVSTTTKYAAPMLPKASGYQLPASDIAFKNDGCDFIYAGLVSNQFTLSQESVEPPQISFDLIGSGKFVNPVGFTIPTPASNVPCLTGGDSQIIYTDSGGTQDMYTVADVRRWSVTASNNLVTEPARTRKPSDPLTGPTGGQARHIQSLKRGIRTVTAEIVVAFGSTIPYWTQSAKNEQLTNVKFTVKGPLITGSTYYLIEVILPVCTIRATPGVDSNGDAAYTLQISALEDAVTMGGATVAVTIPTTANFN